MEIRVYRNGETKRLELRNTAAKNDQQFIDLNEFRDITVSIVGEQISIKRKSELIVRSDPSNFKDKNGGSLGNSPRIVADKIEAIISNRKEVDSFVIGDDLSQKSSETIFTHNKAGTDGLGGRLIVDDDKAKVNVTRTTGQGTTGLEVLVTGPSGADLGSIVGKGAYSGDTRTMFTAQASTGQIYDSKFTVHDRFEVEGEANFLDAININGNELSITDLDKVPASLGTSGQVLAVNSVGTALEFVNQSGGSGGTGSASEALFVIDSTGGTDNVTSTASNLTLDSTQFISNASNFTVSNNEVTVNMDMRACISFHVGFKDPNGADRSEGQAFLERSTDSGTTWSLVTGSNSFAYLRNGGNNDQDTATSGNVIMAVSNGDKFRVRVKTTGTGLTASTIANMSGFSIFDLLGGATGATGATGPAGADGADGADGTNGTNGTDGADGTGFTGGSYNSSTGVVTFTSNDGLGFSTGDLRGADGADGADGTNGTNGTNGTDGADGLGFTGGSYNSSTGIVTFTSDDGLGFSTGDLRGADGADGSTNTLDGQKIEFITRSTAYSNGSYEGKVMKFGTATIQTLKLYQYTSSGWSPTDANQTGKAEGLLGLALGTSESSDGLLLDGLISATAFTGFSAGDKLYVSETESAITNTAPTATGSIVRIVGYALGSGYIHFNPSDNFIELA